MGGADAGAALRAAPSERTKAQLEVVASAWLLAVPCAVVVVLAAYFVGPPLGRLLHPESAGYTFFPIEVPLVKPEPEEQGRFLVLLLGPLLLSGAIALAARRGLRVPAAWTTRGVLAVQLALSGLVLGCVIGQYGLRFQYRGPNEVWPARFFVPATLAVAAVVAVAVSAAVRRDDVVATVSRWTRETRIKVLATWLAVALVTVTWLLPVINRDELIPWTGFSIAYTSQFYLDEVFALFNGLTPFVDFTTQYSSLWPYVSAVVMLAFGKSLLAFTLTMFAICCAALLAIFAVLRRASGNVVLAALLYVPFLATSLFTINETVEDPFTVGTYIALYPLRYGVPLILAWLTARYLEAPERRRMVPLFVVAGLGALNNLDFGLAAAGASVGAILWTTGGLRRDVVLPLVRGVAVGAVIALALVSALTLLRAGELPDLGRLLDYPRLYVTGYVLNPIPGLLGLHLVLYLTYVAAIGLATVRALNGEANRVLTGMLAWSGIFGLGAASYFVAESGRVQLAACFTPWALALALLTVAVVQQLVATRPRWTHPAQLLVLLGAGVALCSVAQIPPPWKQLDRVVGPRPAEPPRSFASPLEPPAETRNFFASVAYGDRFYLKRGAPVAILVAFGHRIADQFGIVNVLRYTGTDSIHTVERLATVVRDLRAAGGNTLIAPDQAAMSEALQRLGFLAVTRAGLSAQPTRSELIGLPTYLVEVNAWTKWVDGENLHPALLRRERGRPVRGY